IFEVVALPVRAQFSWVNSILVSDFDGDKKKDLLLAGNNYAVRAEMGRDDASVGLFLKGDGKNNFTPQTNLQSGFNAPGDVRDMKLIGISSGDQIILVGKNGSDLQMIEVRK
ncbi:MAG: hypothetical protein LH473_13395, partial [Chitinophagales bacterium]|nr:hypothetical protein [Chitinophagales bacterium]